MTISLSAQTLKFFAYHLTVVEAWDVIRSAAPESKMAHSSGGRLHVETGLYSNHPDFGVAKLRVRSCDPNEAVFACLAAMVSAVNGIGLYMMCDNENNLVGKLHWNLGDNPANSLFTLTVPGTVSEFASLLPEPHKKLLSA